MSEPIKDTVHAAEETVRTGWTRLRKYTRAALQALPTLWSRTKEIDILMYSSALAFSVVLTVVPLLLLSASVIGIVFSSSDSVTQLKAILDAAVPPQPFADNIRSSILNAVTDLAAYRTSLGVAGIVFLAFTASFLFDIVRTVLHKIYRIPRTRGLVASFLHDLGFVFLAFVLLLASNLAVWIIRLMEGALREYPGIYERILPEFLESLPAGIVILLTAVMFYVVYRFLTDAKPPRAAAIASTITMTALWLAAGKIFSVYLSRFSLIGSLYGPYAFILVLLLWVYYSSMAFVFGAIVGEAFWEQLRRLTREQGGD
jgi:membrane protein